MVIICISIIYQHWHGAVQLFYIFRDKLSGTIYFPRVINMAVEVLVMQEAMASASLGIN